ncbi:hydrogenase large subunit [Occallatibacter riparius]|uniref:Nickel-dependent hydrogenase large subunit n=1 Tax=Occallatibacter riparius TaxID=1002689 RepID=A0A9J7BM74_9BACT|nr:nickel-dependent hydrogenase large subunit [Occallatibacter riparius]UWZ83593.1 nickel-dependent hydrogenase large subunit [Occallatibacter riparius]
MSYKIPMGPFHPALEEPYKLDMTCEGETVREAKLHIGFNFRGIEHLAETRNYIQVVALMERVCGICSFIHTLTLCQAMEKLTGLEPPPRAKYIRVAMAELERLHSHVLWAGIAAKLMGFKTMFMTCFELREKVMDVLQAISGNRVNYSMNCIGGVNRDIEDPLSLLPMIDVLEREMVRTVIPIFTTSRTAMSRCAGIGVLTHEKALSLAVVGPVARASGVGQDLRRDAPYAAYEEMQFEVPVEPDGDVKARLLVRALEILESCKILRQALGNMPPGEIVTGDGKFNFISGTATARVEAPRGEVMYSVTWKEHSRNPSRVHVRTPTFANMPAVRYMVMGARLADTPLIQASIDPCYSCTDR